MTVDSHGPIPTRGVASRTYEDGVGVRVQERSTGGVLKKRGGVRVYTLAADIAIKFSRMRIFQKTITLTFCPYISTYRR